MKSQHNHDYGEVFAFLGKGPEDFDRGESHPSAVGYAAAISDLTEALSDRDLLAAYQCSGGEPSDPEVEAIRAEIAQRELDI